ncbi:peptidase C1B bleomycin hydrolase [Peniophora sp. CONT]|nr:peptidase C1B bleomycin hydrolase [Peniophora sp. CONT]
MGATSSKPQAPAMSPAVKRESVDEKVDLKAQVPLAAPLSADGTISLSSIADWESEAQSSAKTQLARTIFSQTNINTLLKREVKIADYHVFNTELPFKTGPITSQRSSGRCWLFATTNVLRYDIMKKLNLSDFQCSQNYLFFWDKLNKANYYLELSIQEADRPLDDRLINHLAGDLISDGGQWDMVVNLLETYGVVPQPVYPESLHSSLSGPINSLLKTRLREHALILRELTQSLRSQGVSAASAQATLRAKKEELIAEVYNVMTATLGVPPLPDATFTWDYYDKDGKPHTWEGTPKQFYKDFTSKTYPVAESFSLINDPRNEYKKLYTVDKLGNVWGGRPVLYVNTQIDDLKNAVVKSIKAGIPVFFGCDVGQSSDRNLGIMDADINAYENAFDISLTLSKADRIRTNESAMTHAMVISAVHLDTAGKPVRYKVENSWGDAVGDKGYFVMSDKWFEEYVYQVVVPKALATKELVKVFEGDERIVLPAWDPMGALA